MEGNFKLKMNSDLLGVGKGGIIVNDSVTYIVTSKPARKWYKLLLQFITFGFYKAPWQYTLRPYNND